MHDETPPNRPSDEPLPKVSAPGSPTPAPPPTAGSDDEASFLQRYDPGHFERPSVTVDTALISVVDGDLWTLLVRRREHPFRHGWALPGGFVGIDESLEQAAGRVLGDKAGVHGMFLEQLYTFGDPDRDPRTRVITVVYYALMDRIRFADIDTATEGAGVERVVARLRVPWSGEVGGAVTAEDPEGTPLDLAFDHGEILGMVVKRLRGKLDYTPISFELLPRQFTLQQLRAVYETVVGKPHNKDSFRRRMLASGLIRPTGIRQQDVGHRPAELYEFRDPRQG